MKKNILLVVLILILGVSVYFAFFNKKTATEVVKTDSIKEYKYNLYNNSSDNYKTMFKELKELLSKDDFSEEEYVTLISKMFIDDFYSLNLKVSNLNIGGVDFVYSKMKQNFKENAKDTIYKYVESNIYGDRDQELPEVDQVNVDSIKTVTFYYNDTKDTNSYEVKVSWTYKKDLGYDTSKTLYFVHEKSKLSIVEMS